MVTLSRRQKRIVIFLLSEKDYVTISQLADGFSVSARTIRYDIAQIRSYLEERNMKIDSVPHKGVKIFALPDQKNNVLSNIDDVTVLTRSEQVRAIILELLSGHVNTYDSLAQICGVSRQTVIGEFPEVENAFARFGIRVLKEKGHGVRIEGRESAVWNMAVSLLGYGSAERSSFSSMYFFRDLQLTKAREVISMLEDKLRICFYDAQKVEAVLAFCFYRILNGHRFAEEDCPINPGQADIAGEYAAYCDVLKQFGLSEGEQLFLVKVILGFKSKSCDPKTDTSEAQEIAEYLMNQLQIIHPLQESDQRKFLQGLGAHLNVALYRIRNHIPIRNDMVEQIKINIPLMYEYTKQQLLKCEKKYQIIFDENEIAYIALYAASAYELSLSLDSQVTILIECPFGTTTSSILCARMKQMFPECSIVGPLSRGETEKYIAENRVDLIVATTLEYFDGIPTLKVSPLLTEEDSEKIRSQYSQIHYSHMCTNFMEGYANSDAGRMLRASIGNFVDADGIQIVDSMSSWQDAIRKAAAPLLTAGKIEQRYVNRMIEAVEQLGTYMVMVPETAFVHAGTEDGIHEDCCSLLVLRHPVLFGTRNAKVVRNIVVLGVKEHERTDLLDLVSIFSNVSNQRLLSSGNINCEIIRNLHN